MRTVDFAFKELGRRKRRTLAGILCILLGISIFVAARTINKGLYDKAKEQLLRFGANIIVQPKGEPLNLFSSTVSNSTLFPERYADNVWNIEHKNMLVAVSPKLYERFEVENVGLLVVGITPDEGKAKPWWMIDSQVLDEFPIGKQVLLGYYAAAHLEKPSRSEAERRSSLSQIELKGETFEVAGVLDETGSEDDFMAFVPLDVLQDITNKKGLVNQIEVSTSCIACSSMDVYKIAKEINKAMPDDVRALPVKQIADAQMGTLKKIEGFTRIIYIVVLCLSAFLLMNYMSSSVSEQRREIGMLLAMGMNAAKIYKIFVSKALILGIIGGLAGYAIGTLISVVLGPQVADAQISPLLHILPYSLLISTVICVISSIVPARQASKLDAVEALREV